ncbi:uncharacterized protein C2orf80 homolog [Prinia subflava]|uniref:uncharacterized protein C2orf80 homolog n=1 Tax=Prinia subflava TaxID=208062 RepID=UPI002FE1DF94
MSSPPSPGCRRISSPPSGAALPVGLEAPRIEARLLSPVPAPQSETAPGMPQKRPRVLLKYISHPKTRNSIPIEEIFEIYSMRPSATHWQNSAKDHWIQPFKMSLHPSALLTAPEAAEHAQKKSIKYQTPTAHQKQGPHSARTAEKNSKQLDTLTRGKQLGVKIGLENSHKAVKQFLQCNRECPSLVYPSQLSLSALQSPSLLMDSALPAVLVLINICILQGATEAKQGISPRKPGTNSEGRRANEAKP